MLFKMFQLQVVPFSLAVSLSEASSDMIWISGMVDKEGLRIMSELLSGVTSIWIAGMTVMLSAAAGMANTRSSEGVHASSLSSGISLSGSLSSSSELELV